MPLTARSFLPPLAAIAAAFLAGMAARQVQADDTLVPVDIRDVAVGGEIGRRIEITVHNNLLQLDTDKDFLAPFRAKSAKDGYIGLGKLIDATVRFAAHTESPQVMALKNRLVDETIKTQEPDGYIGIMGSPDRMWKLWDVHEMCYLVLGLTSDYQYFGQQRSLAAARKLADYLLEHWSAMPADWQQQTHLAVHMATIGLERSLLALWRETDDPRYLAFCTQQRALPEWNLGIVFGRRELLEGHVYAYLCRCVAQLDLYQQQPDGKLLSSPRRAAQFMTAQDGMNITGAVGQCEIWTDDQDGRGDAGETCATAYQIRLFERLLRIEGRSLYGDLLERMIYNTLFAAQSPDGRRIRYYTPLEGERAYHPGDTYCCPNNFRRVVAELPAMVYYRSGRGVAVNLYTPSSATVDLGDSVSLRIQQDTDYPASGHVRVRLDPSRPVAFPLRLRIPRWCKTPAVAINGDPWERPIPSGDFLVIERQWQSGDQVTLDLPMNWRLIRGRKRQSGRAAVMRGPLVFCWNPSQVESLKNRDAADLGAMLIDPGSLRDLPGHHTVRPGGMACAIKAGEGRFEIGVSGNLTLELEEFPDPQGKVTYFRLPDLSLAEPDELLSGDGK